MATHKTSLAEGNVPKPDDVAPSDDLLVYARYLFTGTASATERAKQYDYEFTLFDYSGKNLKPSLFQPAAGDPDPKASHDIPGYLLQQHFIECDGVVVVAPLMESAEASVHMARLAESVSALVEAHKSAHRSNQLAATPLPLAIAISRADEIDAITKSTAPNADLQERVQRWLKTDARAEPYRRLISASEQLVGASNVRVFAVSALGATEICELVYEEDRVKNRDAASSGSPGRRFERYYGTKQSVEARKPHRMVYVDSRGRSTAATAFDPGTHTVSLSDGTQVAFDAKDRGKDSDWLEAKVRVERAADGEIRLQSYGIDAPFSWLATRYDELVADAITTSIGRIRVRNLHFALGRKASTHEKWQLEDALKIAGSLQVRSAPRKSIERGVAAAKRRRALRTITTSSVVISALLLGVVSAEHAALSGHIQSIDRSMARPVEGRVSVEDRKADLEKLQALSTAPEWRYLIHRHLMPSTPAFDQRISAAERLATEEIAVTKLVNERLRYVEDLNQKMRSPTLTWATVCSEFKVAREKISWLSTVPHPVKSEVWQEISNAFVRIGEVYAKDIRDTKFARIDEDIDKIKPATLAACANDDEVRKAIDKPLADLRQNLGSEHRAWLDGQNNYCASLKELESPTARELSDVALNEKKRATTIAAQGRVRNLASEFLKTLQDIDTESKAKKTIADALEILSRLDGLNFGCFATIADTAARQEFLEARRKIKLETTEALYKQYSARADEYSRDPRNMLKPAPRNHLGFLADEFERFARLAETKDLRVSKVKDHAACIRPAEPIEVTLVGARYFGNQWTRTSSGSIFLRWPKATSDKLAQITFAGGYFTAGPHWNIETPSLPINAKALMPIADFLEIEIHAETLPAQPKTGIQNKIGLLELFEGGQLELPGSDIFIASPEWPLKWGVFGGIDYITKIKLEFKIKQCIRALQ